MSSTTNSKIDVSANGDTVMILDFNSGINPSTQSRNVMIKTFLGTPYFKHKWANGKIQLPGEKEEEAFMAYNVEKDLVYVSFPHIEEAATITPSRFDLHGSQFRKFDNSYENAGRGFYEVLDEGEFTLLKKYKCVVRTGKIESNNGYEASGAGGYDGEFYQYYDYYILYEDRINIIKGQKHFQKYFQRKGVTEVDVDIKNDSEIRAFIRTLNAKWKFTY